MFLNHKKITFDEKMHYIDYKIDTHESEIEHLKYEKCRALFKEGKDTNVDVKNEKYTKYYTPKENDVVLDCGAFDGMTTMKFFKRCKQVICIEADMYNFIYLNEQLKNRENIVMVNVALSDRTDIVKNIRCEKNFSLDGNACTMLCDKIKDRKKFYRYVICDTIDNIMGYLHIPCVDVVKMDIQGSEVNALKGAVDTLRDVHYIVVESHMVDGVSTCDFICRFLDDNGFDVIVENTLIYGVLRS